MPKVALYNISGEQIAEIELNDAIFGIEPNEAVVHEAVVMQLASLRRGTHATKTRAEVRGGGRKPWRQKGTGRARVGSIRSPLWRKGGITFGPQPRDYAYRLPRKKARLAVKSVLSAKVKANEMVVLDQLEFPEPKTKQMLEVLGKLKIKEKVLVVTAEQNDNVQKSGRNIPGVKFLTAEGINVYDLLNYDRLLITKDAVTKLEEVFS
ncbi:MAG TPA: 50S ribosomal protein L4 [Clostridia bacterium]|jgi:large subunit ribosomal protein L4|nr:50S ribosomal protein L4 [Clostridia bacterium]HHY06168.1 50S ribosomal protein L4 [Clostridia bacterium]